MDNILKQKKWLRNVYNTIKAESDKNYPSSFWQALESKKKKIFEDETSLSEAINILIEITETILNAAKKRFMPDKYEQINKDDISYCENIFDEIAMIWDSEKINIYEKYSDILKLVNHVPNEKFTLKSLEKDLTIIKNKYLDKKND
ncbi:MAG: hypothetical protein PHN56_03625 [Candidatus Nanoarchaeia archaeon]|nr:hypothetical protein [Candidatus Nanoarchaeia archaeon]